MTFSWFNDDLDHRRRRGLYRRRRRLASGQGAHVRLAGRDLVNFSSNDYLDLATDSRLARAAARAARRYGSGAGASALVSGLTPPLRALERELAAWERCDAVLVFSSGFAANLAVVSSLAGREDAIFSDAWNHASLIDGCRLSRAAVHVYPHADIGHLAALLEREGRAARRRLIVSDSVFSMDGDLAPFTGLLDLAARYDCLLILDEAHATGVLGEGGRGLSETVAASDRLIKVGTLSKALGAQGGFVCGPRVLIDFLINHARPYIFSTALAPPIAAAARAAVRVIGEEPERRHRLLALARRLRDQLRGMGLDVRGEEVPIVPVIVGPPQAAVQMSRALQESGLLVPAIRPPSVPEGTARLRISLTAGHTEGDVDRLVAALAELRSLTT
jgi:8-amino-7-oxononanoate synthase